MAFSPTEAQKKAIYENGNILVSAAAGSGKTAVLVERVITKLCDKENPVNADELLIVTFTNAAAAEMRSRIEARLDEECRKSPQDPALLMQKHLLSSAKICTIDSFCIDLVRENFDKLDISPDFKIGDTAALNEIDNQVLFSIINQRLEQKDPAFFELLDLVGAEFDEKNFAELVLSLYNYSRQLPFPEKWYDFLLECYNNGVFSKDSIWYKYAFSNAEKVISSAKKLALNALDDISSIEEAEKAYGGIFNDLVNKITDLEKCQKTGEWDTLYFALCDFKVLRMPSVRGLSDYPIIASAKDTYKYLGSKAFEGLKKIFCADLSFINNQHAKIYPCIKILVGILKEFDQKLFCEYKNQNVFTFHNTEHLALKLLYDCETDTVTQHAKELFAAFKEVMVDEYQDINDLQDTLFKVLSGNEKNLFVVGDIKQSIYAFRGANPDNFLSKKKSYTDIDIAQDGAHKKIILGNNFRSCEQVCSFVNYIFGLFMQSFSGNIEYNSEEELIPTADFPNIDNCAVSMDIIDCSQTDRQALVCEADQIAQFIKNTMSGPECIKQDKNTLRHAQYGDFAILLRNVSNKAPVLVSRLKELGIPVNLSVGSFAESIEVSTFLSLLKVIDNPQRDIELATILMSPIYRFTPDDLAKIRAMKKDGNFYSAVIFAANNGDKKSKEFLTSIEEYRLLAATMPLDKLVSKLLVQTEYLNIASALSDGEKRLNNLLLLCDYATQFVSNNNGTLSGFVNFVISQSSNLSIGAGDSASDSVRIMTIHASKGLQFPICIVAGAASKFNDFESRFASAYSVKYGLGFKYFDEDDKQKYTTIAREVILDDIKNSGLEEELRLLYVALTRAQDKLHFVASYSNFENALQNYKNLVISSGNKIDYSLFSRTKSYADWLMTALLLHPDSKTLRSHSDGIIPTESDSKVAINIVNATDLITEDSPQADLEYTVENEIVESLTENFKYKYPYERLSEIQSKISVSALTNKAEHDKYAFSAKPSFMSGGITATGRGTAMHKVMEFFDFSKSDKIEQEIERLYEWQFISLEERDSLNIEGLEAFFSSELFARIKNSSLVKREMRFITELPVCEIDNTLPKEYSNENIIVQGAVDICFKEGDSIVILDFKTDRVDDIVDLANAYGEQLSVYAAACQKIFGLKVKEKIIYSFSKSDYIKI